MFASFLCALFSTNPHIWPSHCRFFCLLCDQFTQSDENKFISRLVSQQKPGFVLAEHKAAAASCTSLSESAHFQYI